MNVLSAFKKNRILVQRTSIQLVLLKQVKSRVILPGMIALIVLILGFWINTIEVVVISIIVASLCLVSATKNWKGKTILIIDTVKNELILPSINQYEKSSSYDTNSVIRIYYESSINKIVNYVFAEIDGMEKPLFLLKIRNSSEEEIHNLTNWIMKQINPTH